MDKYLKMSFLAIAGFNIKADFREEAMKYASNALFGGASNVFARYGHSGMEFIAGVGGTVKQGEAIYDLDEKTKDLKTKSNAYMKASGGLMMRSGFGVENLQFGIDLGFSGFHDYFSFKMGPHIYGRYLDVFVRVGGGTARYIIDEVNINDIYTYCQIGYYFYENFFLAITGEYNFGRKFNDVSKGGEKNTINGLAVYISVGLFGSLKSATLDTISDEEEARELAKLRAKDKYKAEKALKAGKA